jgi:hypothetical protein
VAIAGYLFCPALRERKKSHLLNVKSCSTGTGYDPLCFFKAELVALPDDRVIVCNADFCEVYLKKMRAHPQI